MPELEQALSEVAAEMATRTDRGNVASYIPQLGKVDPRKFALANYMKSFGNLHHEPELALGVYFHHCAVAMSCRQLAMAGRFLANGGRNPATGHSVVSAERARRICALMLTCGHYDGSGDFAFHVGIPGKSGVGGGILGIVPGVASLAVWSPGLNENG